ncbi:MAG TPA: chemotaxis protein CheB [Acidimicrobiia bacterium]
MVGRDIVVIGASAGGVEALRRVVGDLPEDLPAAVFLVLHTAPHSGTALLRILARQTSLPVTHPGDGEPIRPGHVYVAVPDRHMVLDEQAVRVTSGPKENGYRPAVDTLFRTAAASYGPRVIGVVLSGTRDDGTAGLRAIRARGGVAIVQDPEDALFPGMPQSALADDPPDFVLPVGEIGAQIAKLAREEAPVGRALEARAAGRWGRIGPVSSVSDQDEPEGPAEDSLSEADHDDFERLLGYLKRSRGFDFTGYKRASLMRRVSARMKAVGTETFAEYLDFLQVDPGEFTALFDSILINVTSFFRDPTAWQLLGSEILPGLVAAKDPDEPFRVWSAGCATGEEAYTLAIVLAELLGPDEMRRRVKIYGTDVDEGALTIARHATYTPKALATVPEPLFERYFEQIGPSFIFRKDLRRTVIFGRHDLVHAAPISHIDVLACRNTLMYLNSETQARVLNRLHFALEEGGILLLGKAEMLLTHGNLFSPVDLKSRVFVKVSKNLRERLSVINEGGGYEPLEYPLGYRRARELAIDAVPSAMVVVHNSGSVAMVNGAARRLFGLSTREIGRPFQDLEISYRPIELRSAIEQVQKEQRPLIFEQVGWTDGPDSVDCFDVHVVPLADTGGAGVAVAITFIDVSLSRRLHEELEVTNRDLETAYEELQSTNEELETTNEELQSTIEELETTNEELQSTNEELETMNAELQSTNEELQTINDELRLRTGELDAANDFLESLLISHRGGLVVVDQDLRISVWNDQSTELWGLRTDEAPGQHFLNIDIGLPVDELRHPIRAVLAGDSAGETVELDATNRRGRDFRCRVSMTPLLNRDRRIRGVILAMEEMAVN